MITISEIAQLAGTTVRAVRLYHQRGLLPEPPRAANGYRSYGPDHLLALLRIRRMRDLGLPLGRIAELVTGPPHAMREALAALDDDLARQAEAVAARRAAIAEVLALPGDLTLPPDLAVLLERARAAGYPESVLEEERDAALLAMAVDPGAAEPLRRYYELALADGGALLTASREFAALEDAASDDPRVPAVARALAAATAAVVDALVAEDGAPTSPDDPPDRAERFHRLAGELLDRFHAGRGSPAQREVTDLVSAELAARYAHLAEH